MESDEKLEVNITGASEADVPALIQSQFLKMNDYRSNLEVARKKATEAKERIDSASKEKLGILKYKSTIEGIQETQMYLSEATLQNTEAQEKSFEYQQALAEITKYLFGLGVTSITMNRTVVKELEMRLSHASEEELDDMAKEEITNLIRELKGQEDIMKKQSDLLLKVKGHEDRIIKMESEEDTLNREIEDARNKNIRLSEEIVLLKKERMKDQKRIKALFTVLGIFIILAIAVAVFALLKK